MPEPLIWDYMIDLLLVIYFYFEIFKYYLLFFNIFLDFILDLFEFLKIYYHFFTFFFLIFKIFLEFNF